MGRGSGRWVRLPAMSIVPRRSRPLPTVALVLALALSVAVASCTSSDGKGSSSTKATVGSAATVEASSTTVAPTTSAAPTTTVAAKPTGEPTPLAAAQRLYDTWKAGDKASAALVATPDAVAGVWATAPGDYAEYNSCDSAEFPTSGCLFRGDSGTIQFTMQKQTDKAGKVAWVVIDALFSPP